MRDAVKVFIFLISCFNSVLCSGAVSSLRSLRVKVKTLRLSKSYVPMELTLAFVLSLFGEL